MKQLLFSLVTAVAVLGLQANAEAMFINTLIDDFSDPAAPTHAAAPGLPMDHSTEASGGTSGSVLVLGSGTDIALDRGLSGALGTLTAGGGDLTILLSPGQSAGIDWDVAFFDFTGIQTISLFGLTNSLPLAGVLEFILWQDGVMADTQVVNLAALSTTDVYMTALPIGTGLIGLQITNLGSGAFLGSLDQVVANPEPATMALIGLGVLGGAVGYRRRRKEDAVTPTTSA